MVASATSCHILCHLPSLVSIVKAMVLTEHAQICTCALLFSISDADKAKVLSMLKRLEEGDESLVDAVGEGEEGCVEDSRPLEERLAGLDLGGWVGVFPVS